MKKRYIFLVAWVLVLVMTGIPYAQCYPSAGLDHMDPTTATLELEINGIGSETLTATGPTKVARGDPYDPGDGRIKIDTEIISMRLRGISFLVGRITIVESPTKSSSGFIQQQTRSRDFPADSFFDVFVEIQTTLPPPLSTLHHDHDEPARMEATIHSIPPWGSLYTSPALEIPLKDEEGETIGSIKHVSHRIPRIPSPPPVGGIKIPVNKLGLLAPYIGLASTIMAAVVVTATYVKRIKYRKENR